MFGGVYPGQTYPAQGYPGDQSAVVFVFADASETSIGVTLGRRTVGSATVVRGLGLTGEQRTLGSARVVRSIGVTGEVRDLGETI